MEKKGSCKKFITRKLSIILSCVILVSCVGGVYWYNRSLVPELPESVIDTWDDDGVIVPEEEVPLAAEPKTTTKTTTRTTKKTVRMSKAASRTYSKNRPAVSKKSSSSSSKTSNGVKTVTAKNTTVKTAITDKYTKKSKNKVVVTKTTTTVKTTVTATKVQNKAEVTNLSAVDNSVAGTLDARVSKAFTELGFKVTINPNAPYAGYFNAASQSITLKKENNTLYHEMGHFLAFIAGNVDKTSSFVSVFNGEKGKYTASNKAYVIQNSSEYFAESFKNYTENPSALKASRPKTYAAIVNALNKVTDSQINKIKTVYTRLGTWKF